jgi:hypothetical protein
MHAVRHVNINTPMIINIYNFQNRLSQYCFHMYALIMSIFNYA